MVDEATIKIAELFKKNIENYPEEEKKELADKVYSEFERLIKRCRKEIVLKKAVAAIGKRAN